MGTDKQTSHNPLKDAVERVERAKGADKNALWVATGAAGVTLLVLADTALEGAWWAIIVVAVAFALAYRIAKIVLYRSRDLGALPLLGDLQPRTVSPQNATAAQVSTDVPAAPRPRSALVPRLSFAPRLHPHEVLLGETVGVETLRGGRTDVDARDLPLGVFLITRKGIAFLPAARGKLEEMIGEIPAAVTAQIAGQFFEPVEFAERIRTVEEVTREPPTIAGWMDIALKQKHHFVIAWGDLTGVTLAREHTVLTRDSGSGESEDFIILDASPSWPEGLMQQRIVADLKEAVHAKILRPKCEELRSLVRAEMNPGTSDDDIGNEAARRTMAWFSATKPDLESAVKAAMAPVLDDYAFLPLVVEKQPWLFKHNAPEEPVAADRPAGGV